jgi:hypothetical protein
MSNEPQNTPPDSESFAKETAKEAGKGLLKEGKATVKWGLWGAVVGAVALGGTGWFKFGTTMGLIGAGVGAVVGGIGAAWFYISASSL